MKLLDLFSGGGGAAEGYLRAGFEVVGVDVADHSAYYPGSFVQGDALEYVAMHGRRFDVIHASPPCPRYSSATPKNARDNHPDLVAPTRDALNATGRPWVMENVPGSPVRPDLVLCGSHFDLTASGYLLKRHRLFELSGMTVGQPVCTCADWRGRTASVTGTLPSYTGQTYRRPRNGTKFSLEDARKVMGIDLPSKPLVQAIPAAYAEYIGSNLRIEKKS